MATTSKSVDYESVNAGEAIEATRLRSPVLRDPCLSRVDVQPSDIVERGQDASGKADNLQGHVLFKNIDHVAETVSEDGVS